mgnify:CR=1 FL=1
MRGDIYIISAPSGTGKSTVIRKVLKIVPGLFFSISYTTRALRFKEINGKDYFFVSKEEFEKLIKEGEFIEYCKVHNNFYGTSRSQVIPLLEKGLDVILDIDVKGAIRVKEKFPEAILIFMIPPSIEELLKRLEKRHTDSPKELETRLQTLKEEILYWEYYDYILVNDYINNTIDNVKSIIVSNRLRREKQASIIEEIVKNNILNKL